MRVLRSIHTASCPPLVTSSGPASTAVTPTKAVTVESGGGPQGRWAPAVVAAPDGFAWHAVDSLRVVASCTFRAVIPDPFLEPPAWGDRPAGPVLLGAVTKS